MSAFKHNTSSKPESKPDLGQEGATITAANGLQLLQEVRSLLHFHRRLGITGYPFAPQFDAFLRKKTETAPVVAGKGAVQQEAERQRDVAPSPVTKDEALGQLVRITDEIATCNRCPLANQRVAFSVGFGSAQPDLLVIGDWSTRQGEQQENLQFGPEEDAMLQKMMEAIGLQASQLYVTNCLKCIPQNPDTVDLQWAESCFFHLGRQVELLRPKVLLAMGDMATQVLLKTTQPLIRLRGRFYSYRLADGRSIELMPTLHPRFLLQYSEMKRAVWEDLQQVRRCLASTV
jgi:DNA polymerase